MRIASVAEVKAKFSGYIKASQQGPVVVTKNGKPVAVLLAITEAILILLPPHRR